MTVIEVLSLSKSYQLKGSNFARFDALKNVSFSITEGESVGIIGHNGAGKSTLLKLLSDVAFPTSGEAKVVGTFASLLEVGTGFHPDLSGRDNIFLNASIIGIPKKEVGEELENIISFSGVGKFIDEPLHTYSSGMKLRLAFSVLAHLKTDIIALDEVLAVGDSMFQMKCMERIFDFKKQGRTILFVSHNLSAVKKLCERTLVIESGEIVFDGASDLAIQFYLNNQKTSGLNNQFLKELTNHCTTKNATINLNIEQLESNVEFDFGLNISDPSGNQLYHFSNRFIDQRLIPENGKLNLKLDFNHSLKPGNYSVSIYLGQNHEELAWMENVTELVVPPYNPYGFHNPDAIQSAMIADFNISTT
ncbi:MAG: ATP-binding cassette domain-containing protein [Flavobacteriales bacterium]|nr:ATP-binding cassette domain-containing protein [Flavobacteriales bacterium]